MKLQLNRIRALLDHHYKESGVTGTISVYEEDSCIFNFSISDNSRPFAAQLSSRTAYGMASAAKLFTALAALILVQRKRIKLSSTVHELLGDTLLGIDPTTTVQQLLTHSSGVSEYFNDCKPNGFEEVWRSVPTYQIRTPRDFLPLLQSCTTDDQAEGLFRYRNSGFVILGLIVETASGRSFSSFVEENIFGPAGMEDSGYYEIDRLPSHASVGYISDNNGQWKTNIFSIPAKGGGEGGTYCSPDDMHRLWRSILQGRLLQPLYRDLFLTAQVQDGCDGEWFYSYGYWINRVAGRLIKYTCVGEDPGCSIRYLYYPGEHIALAVFTNVSDGAGKLAIDLQKLMFGSFGQQMDEPATLRTCVTALSSCSSRAAPTTQSDLASVTVSTA